MRILHLEDNPHDAELIKETLLSSGIECDISVVEGREKYLQALAEGGWDLVLSDFKLPSFDGVSALALISEKNIDVPFIFVSGTIEEELAIESLKQGATDYVFKHRLSRLVPSIKRALQEVCERRQHKQAQDEILEAKKELEKMLEELKKTQNQLIQQERLRALGQMASGIAHDFNNALAAILGYSELMLRDDRYLHDQDRRVIFSENLKAIHTSAQDAATIVSRLRQFGKPREATHPFKPVHLNPLIEETITLTQPKWGIQAMSKGIDVRIEKHFEDIPPVEGNEQQLREILTNLIFNAVDALSQKGTISFRTALLNDKVHLEVRDTGRGMDEEVRLKCLEPFFTTKGEEGTGLGLSMVNGIIQQHQGTLQIESEPGKGTAFLITLPVATTFPVQKKPEQQVELRSLSILYIEDEPAVQAVISKYLEAEGHVVEKAESGPEALKIFYMNTNKYDVVITDRTMPQMRGEEVALIIKKIRPEQRIILLSGSSDFSNMEEMNNIDLILNKPVTMDQLRKALREVLKEA